VNKVTNLSTVVRGKAEPDSTVSIKAGNKELGNTQVDNDDLFKIKVSKQKIGTELVIIATDQSDNISETTKIKMIDGKVLAESTSLLGHIKSGKSYIYSDLDNKVEKESSEGYKDAVYYIKKQATFNGEDYYFISENSSATSGVIGWMKASDLSTHVHKAVYKKSYI